MLTSESILRSVHVAMLLVVAAMVPGTSYAQLKGHYVPGFTGLQNGSQGPPP